MSAFRRISYVVHPGVRLRSRKPCRRRDPVKAARAHHLQMLCDKRGHASQARWHEVTHVLRGIGFEVGWGDTVGRVKDSMHELLDILQVRPRHRTHSPLGTHTSQQMSSCADRDRCLLLQCCACEHTSVPSTLQMFCVIESLDAFVDRCNQAPDDDTVASFLGRLPMINDVRCSVQRLSIAFLSSVSGHDVELSWGGKLPKHR